ncbi:hypothetical protein BD769DRAFT_1414756 [Suillus cothurnatus]|nr:hypothetical protein BD769DRAFT_1414756 [Suillus cothurnatus]
MRKYYISIVSANRQCLFVFSLLTTLCTIHCKGEDRSGGRAQFALASTTVFDSLHDERFVWNTGDALGLILQGSRACILVRLMEYARLLSGRLN